MTKPSSTIPSFDEIQLLPLDTDALIEQRVGDLVGHAITRQLWLMFLDQLDLQIPLLLPVDGLPAAPDRRGWDCILAAVRDIMNDCHAASIVVVQERPGPARFSKRDLEWARLIREGCAECGIPLRAQVLSHRSGVRWIAADDLA